jgi:MYXO-CTERM domain-containing protein
MISSLLETLETRRKQTRASAVTGVRALTAAVACLTALALAPGSARASGPYVILRDDGSLNAKVTNPYAVMRSVMKAYDATGSARPDVISLWTSFSMDKNDVETLFAAAANDVKGIGLENEYGKDGTFPSDFPPLRAMLLHNNVLALDKRAKLEGAPVEGFGEYLFLLELSHLWGPAARVPAGDGGSKDALIGFPFHWSFWMDAGGSPAGGNKWKDNGDGTFTTEPQSPGTVTYSMLDLYLMGLADPSEVRPFGVLENAVPPADVKDPFAGGPLSKTSFPHFGDKPVTVTATRRTFTIEDVVAANGPRVPAKKDAPQSLELGIVLMVRQDATDDEIAKASSAMDALAPRLAPAFERATRGRGKMHVVTKPAAAGPDAGTTTEADAGGSGRGLPGEGPGGGSGGCSTTGDAPATPLVATGLVALATAVAARRRRAR